MPSSGSGTITPVSAAGVPPSTIPDAWPNCAVSLARYAQIVQYDESAFWGVHYTGQEAFACEDRLAFETLSPSDEWKIVQRREVENAIDTVLCE